MSVHVCFHAVSAIHVLRIRAGPGGFHDRSVPDQHGGTIVIGSLALFLSLTTIVACHAAVMFFTVPCAGDPGRHTSSSEGVRNIAGLGN